MATSQNKGDDPKVPPTSSTVLLLLGTIGDTTWRMFVPTIGLMLVGFWIDTQLGTKFWLTAAGVLVGSLIAGFLIRHQLKNVPK